MRLYSIQTFFKTNILEIKDADQELRNLISKIIKTDIHITQCKHKKDSHIMFLKKVFPKDGALYLEGIKNALRGKNFQAYLLEENKAKLLSLTLQSKIPEHIKQAISRYLQDIPEDKIQDLIKLFKQEKQGLAKIEKEFEKK